MRLGRGGQVLPSLALRERVSDAIWRLTSWRWLDAGGQLENNPLSPYGPATENLPETTTPGWLETLEESEAEVAAGSTVPGETVHRELQESIAWLEAKAKTERREATRRR